MRFIAVTLGALAIVNAPVSEAAPASGLRGVVVRGPTKPVCSEAESCEAPAVGLVLRFARAGNVVAQTRTGQAGAYRIALRPGAYVVTTPQRRVGAGLTPRVVRVPAARVARVDFHLDTGIQ